MVTTAAIVGQWGVVSFFLLPWPFEWALDWVVYLILPFLDIPPVPL
tara:strand:+ start:857 stop:994 length:138 start_codon:yes stop_codon:yes gene_type:complete